MEQKNVTDAPQYKCHKVVRAAKVIGWKETDQGPVFELEAGLADYPVKVGWNEGMVGGYLVVYDDGYTSYSPAKAFEDGYLPVLDQPLSADRMLQWFEYKHLPPHLQAVSAPFGELAHRIVTVIPSNPERTVALRKLLEAKDCAVRALLCKY